jgi:hypothetical protein
MSEMSACSGHRAERSTQSGAQKRRHERPIALERR